MKTPPRRTDAARARARTRQLLKRLAFGAVSVLAVGAAGLKLLGRARRRSKD